MINRKRKAINKAIIESKITENGGYTKAQLAEWGIPWEPPKGWKRKLINGPIIGEKLKNLL